MELGLAGRRAMVLGGGGGLGSAIARALAREGAAVMVCDVDIDAADRTTQSIIDAGGQARSVAFDLRAIGDSLDQADLGNDVLGAIDILVNNSGGPPPGAALDVKAETWRKHFEDMFVALTEITRRVLPGMIERRWGRVINSASSGIVAPIPQLAVSNALRSALLGWSKSLAREAAPFGVTVNVIVPGRIATQRIRQLDEARASRERRTVDAVMAESVASIPAGRYGTPEEYADVATFLASERASYVTGSIVRVDGGYIPSV